MITGGKLIKRARQLRGYTQEELAHQYGISIKTLQNYEKERTPVPFDVVMGILEHLHFNINEVSQLAA